MDNCEVNKIKDFLIIFFDLNLCNILKLLESRKEEIVLQGHICSVWEDGQYLRTRDLEKAKAAFEDQLKRLGMDYIDIGMIHYVDSESDLEEVLGGAVIGYCKELKGQGKILTIGMSSHNPVVARKAV